MVGFRLGLGLTVNEVTNALRGAIASGATLLLLNAPLVFDGDSMTDGGGDKADNWTWHTIRNTGGRFTNYAEFGTGGHTSTQMLAGIGEYLDKLAGGVLIVWGIENDIAQNVPHATTISNYENIITAAFNAGVAKVIVLAAAPTRSVLFNGHLARKTDFDAYFAAHPNANVVFLDNAWNGITLASAVDVTGPHSDDYTHPNILGKRLLADNISPAIGALIEAGNAVQALDAISGSARAGIPNFSTAGAGVLATGWTFTNGGDAGVAFSAGTLNGMPSQVITISGANTLTGDSKIKATGALAYVAGRPLVAAGYARFSNAANDGPPVGLSTFGFEAYFRKALYMTRGGLASAGNWSDGLSAPVEGYMRSFPSAALAGGSTVDLEIGWKLAAISNVSVRLEFVDCSVWRAAAA